MKARQTELDVIRIFAFFTLIGTHFFLNKRPAFRGWFSWFPATVAGNGILCLLVSAAVTGLAAFILRFEVRVSLRKKSNTDL